MNVPYAFIYVFCCFALSLEEEYGVFVLMVHYCDVIFCVVLYKCVVYFCLSCLPSRFVTSYNDNYDRQWMSFCPHLKLSYQEASLMHHSRSNHNNNTQFASVAHVPTTTHPFL